MSTTNFEVECNGRAPHGAGRGHPPPAPDVPSDAHGRPVSLITPKDGGPPELPKPRSLLDAQEFIWNKDELPITNYVDLGRQLAAAGDLYRRPGHAGGLLLVGSH